MSVITTPTCKRWRADQRCRASACWRASPLERPGRTLLVVIRVVQVEQVARAADDEDAAWTGGLDNIFMVLTYGKGGKGGEEKVEEHKVHLVDHHLAGEATVQLEPG